MKRSKPKTLPIGEISSGTFRAEDIVPELVYLAKQVRMNREDRKRINTLVREWDTLEDEDDSSTAHSWWNSVGTDRNTDIEILADLYNILDFYAPPYCYLGSLEGDGACIGVWLAQDAIDEALAEGEIARNDEPMGQALYRLVVSDHGNMTLYTRQGREVWGIV